MMVPPRASMRRASGGTDRAPVTGPAKRIIPSSMTRAPSRTGGAPVPSTSWPLQIIVVPDAVFMVEPSDARWYHETCSNATRETAMRRLIVLVTGLFLGSGIFAHAQTTTAPSRKVVLIAGPLDKSHPPGTHEYEKTVRLIKQCLDTSPGLKGIRSEVHFGGWPENPRTLDDADTIVLVASGSDRRLEDHPFLVGDRLKVIAKQMER